MNKLLPSGCAGTGAPLGAGAGFTRRIILVLAIGVGAGFSPVANAQETGGRRTFTDDQGRKLGVGKWADLAVTAEDYLGCADPCLETMLVDLTVVAGRVVWKR